MPGIRTIFIALLSAACVARAQSAVEEGIADFNHGKYSEALIKLKDAQGERGQVFFALTQAAGGNCAAALPGLRRAAADPALARLQAIAATKCYLAEDQIEAAAASLRSLQQQYPHDADVLYLAAKVHMKGFNDATLAMFQHAPASYRVHQLSAEILEIDGRYSDAIPEYRKAIQLNPSAPDLHFRLGRALLLQSHEGKALDEAAAEFQSELRLSPEDSATEFQLGQIALVKGNTPEAKQHLERAIALSPSFVQALIALGKMAGREKNRSREIALLSRATRSQPDNQSAHYALMTAYRDSGNMQQAKAEKAILDKLQKPASGEFSEFLKKIGEKPPQQ